MDLNLKKLNKEQKKAVTFGKGPILIIAGAGTGKTTTLTYRMAYLIKEKNIEPENILALTFTNKAAGEMEDRVNDMLPDSYGRLWVSTFHVFCESVLRENGLDVGLPTNFKLLDDTSSWLLIRRNFDKFKFDYYKPKGSPNRLIDGLVRHFDDCKNQFIFPEDYLKFAQKQEGEEKERLEELARAFEVYQNLLLKNDLLDFGDLINYSLKIFQKRPLILKEYQNKFKYLLIDEFQDINWSQYQLIKELAGSQKNVTVSADDDQSIYQFRGASFDNIFRFQEDFPKAEQVVLNKNYRSTQDILDLSYKFIQKNNPNRLEVSRKVDKKLISIKKEKGIIKHLHFDSQEKEVSGVIQKIKEILEKDKEASFGDIAILIRKNDLANPYVRALERMQIPHRFIALKGLYSKNLVLDIIAYFKLLDNYHEGKALFRVLNFPFLNIALKDIAKINNYSKRKAQSVYETLENIKEIKNKLSGKTVKQINSLLRLIKKHSKMAKTRNVSEVFISFLQDSGYLKYLTEKQDLEEFNYLNQFYEKLKSFEESNLDPCLNNFMEELNLEIESGETGSLEFNPAQGLDIVRIMTIHNAKGLEFKYVFLVDLVHRTFPSDNRRNQIRLPEELKKDTFLKEKKHIEEERRLFYVAMTRAKKGLFLTSAENYKGLKRKKKISVFLKELGYQGEEKIQLQIDEIKAKKEVAVREPELELPDHFSFSQLAAFDQCPLQYKFAHILKIPVSGKMVFSYGKSLHNTLERFVRDFFEKKRKLKYLLKIYESEWIDDWYYSKKQRKEYYEKGKEVLQNFYESFIEEKPQIFSRDGKPFLEKKFNLKVGEYDITGKIDRVDKVRGGVELIDYKTGKVKDKLKKENKKQLLIYEIAAQEVFDLKVKKLTFYYLDGNKKLSFIGSKEDLRQERENIIQEIKEIKKKIFKPQPNWNCRYCDFKDICKHSQ